MNRFLIRGSSPQQFQHVQALLGGKVRVLVSSERRLFLSVADVPEALQDDLRATGARVTVERAVYESPWGGRSTRVRANGKS